MTPKEKAQEITTMLIEYGFNESALKWVAKIAVNEIIANIEPSVSMDVIEARIKYWQEVKQEIEKI